MNENILMELLMQGVVTKEEYKVYNKVNSLKTKVYIKARDEGLDEEEAVKSLITETEA